MHTTEVKKYCDLWTRAQTSNGVRQDDFDSYNWLLTWRGHDVACIRDSDRTEPVYCEIIKFEQNQELVATPVSICSHKMNTFIEQVGKLDAICSLWTDIATNDAGDIVFNIDGTEYGAITFNHSQVGFRMQAGRGTSEDDQYSREKYTIDGMLAYSTRIAKRLDKIDYYNEIKFVESLMHL